MLLHSIVYACRCARVQAEFEACDDGAERIWVGARTPEPSPGDSA